MQTTLAPRAALSTRRLSLCVVGDERFAIDVNRIVSVQQFDVLTKIPSPLDPAGAIAAPSGEIPVFPLAALLGRPWEPGPELRRSHCLIVRGRRGRWGMLVDHASQPTTFSADAILPLPGVVVDPTWPVCVGAIAGSAFRRHRRGTPRGTSVGAIPSSKHDRSAPDSRAMATNLAEESNDPRADDRLWIVLAPERLEPDWSAAATAASPEPSTPAPSERTDRRDEPDAPRDVDASNAPSRAATASASPENAASTENTDSMPTPTPTPVPPGKRRLLVFEPALQPVGGPSIHLGFSVTQVVEILRPLALTAVPFAPARVRGVALWRGRPLPIIDPLRAPRGEFTEPHAPERLVVLQTPRGCAGFLARSRERTYDVPSTLAIAETPSPAPHLSDDAFVLNDRTVVMVDFDRLLTR